MTNEMQKIVQDVLTLDDYEERETYLNNSKTEELISLVLILLDFIQVCQAENNVLQDQLEILEKEVCKF